MKAKITAICIVLCIVIVCVYGYFTVDTRCAKKLASVLHSYDIAKMDSYIDENAEIIFQNNKGVYKDCRENVINAFDNKKFMIPEDASYGYGNGKYENGVRIYL